MRNQIEAFEAWYKKENCGYEDFTICETGHYEDFDIKYAWNVWQSALASQAQRQTEVNVDEEFNKFFEFDTDDKSTVTSVSCKLFAEHIAEMARRNGGKS